MPRTTVLINVIAEHAALYQYSLVNAQDHYIGFAQTETVRTYRLIGVYFQLLHAAAILPTLSACASTFLHCLIYQRSYLLEFDQHGLGNVYSDFKQHHHIWYTLLTSSTLAHH